MKLMLSMSRINATIECFAWMSSAVRGNRDRQLVRVMSAAKWPVMRAAEAVKVSTWQRALRSSPGLSPGSLQRVQHGKATGIVFQVECELGGRKSRWRAAAKKCYRQCAGIDSRPRCDFFLCGVDIRFGAPSNFIRWQSLLVRQRERQMVCECRRRRIHSSIRRFRGLHRFN